MNTHQPIRLFVFDNNGTALDDLHVAYGSVQAIFSVLGLPCPTQEQYRNEIGANFMEFYWGHGVPRDITGDQLNVIRKLYYKMRQKTAKYREDFAGLLGMCISAGAKVGICSAEIPEVLQGFLERGDLRPYFTSKLIRGGAWPSKTPVLASMAQDMGLQSSECVYVDDTDDGIRAAQDAGFRTIGFSNPTGYNSDARIRAARPDRIVNSFTQLGCLVPELTRH